MGELHQAKKDSQLKLINMGRQISDAFRKVTAGASQLADTMRRLLNANKHQPLAPASPTKRAKRRVRAINRAIARKPPRSIFAPLAMKPITHREKPIDLRGLGLIIGAEVVLVHQQPQKTGLVIAIDNPYIAVKPIGAPPSWHYAKNLKPFHTISGKMCYPCVDLSNLIPERYVSSHQLRGNIRGDVQS